MTEIKTRVFHIVVCHSAGAPGATRRTPAPFAQPGGVAITATEGQTVRWRFAPTSYYEPEVLVHGLSSLNY